MNRDTIVGTVEGTGAAINISLGFQPSYVECLNIDGNAAMRQVLAEAKAEKRTAGTFSNPTSNILSAYAGSSVPDPLTGTGAVAAGSAVVTGTSTLFTTELAEGDQISIGGVVRTVLSIASNTSLTVTKDYDAAQSGETIYDLEGKEQGFTIGADTDLNVSGETIKYIAYR